MKLNSMLVMGAFLVCSLSQAESHQIVGEGLQCDPGFTPWMSCSQYKQVQDQRLWVRICKQPGENDTIIPAMIQATKYSENGYTRKVVAFSKFEDGHAVFTGPKRDIENDDGAKGTTHEEFQFGPAKHQPYTHSIHIMLYTETHSGNATVSLGIARGDERLNCWAE